MITTKTKIFAIIFLSLFAILITPVSANKTSSNPSSDTSKDKACKLATSPSECGTQNLECNNGMRDTPRNCLFLEEPIGGKTGYDLYVVDCIKDAKGVDVCTTKLWRGSAITGSTHGPIQAVLTEEKDKPYQGPFTLLYNYLGLIYKYMSGLIVGISVLFVVIGGIQMTTSAGDQAKFDAGKSRITKAIVGVILWFTASLILYTINPTFFAF